MSEMIRQSAEKIGCRNPDLLSRFLYLRSTGITRQGIATEIGVSQKTLYNWNKKLEEQLSRTQTAELVIESIRRHEPRSD